MKVEKGIVEKSGNELMLIAGSEITTLSQDGEVLQYTLSSDIVVTLENDARLFPMKK